MYGLASNGLITPPCGAPQRLRLPPAIRRFPFSSCSSAGVLSHLLMMFKTCRSEIRRATHRGNSAPELPGFFATMALSGSRRVRPRFPRTAELPAPPARVSLAALRSRLAEMPCPLPRRSEPAPVPVASRSVRPCPHLRRAGLGDFPFEACSALLRVTGCQLASPALPRTLSRGFRLASYPAKPLVSFHPYRQLLRWAPSSHRCPRRKGALRNAG